MKLHKLLEEIKETCTSCNECEPCCTWNLLKKCIENERVVLSNMDARSLMSLAEVK